MNFISYEFPLLLAFLLLTFALVRSHPARKIILLLVSCFFYAFWDWRFLGLLGTVTVADYYISVYLMKLEHPGQRKWLLVASIVLNLGFLGFFKYFNFFIESLNVLTEPLGLHTGTLSIILPIGISFYTFETLSYVIDVYQHKARPANSLLDYAIFITFFPRLVAGPIVRPHEFLPQLERGFHLNLDNLVSGSQIFLRGAFKKLVIADQMAIMVDKVYADPLTYHSGTVWLAIFAYSLQILCDFSGYTDMALGTARMIGIQLPDNFNLPYTAQSITEFWQRWHLSLSRWLRDYLYIPLGGNRKGAVRTYINLFITMLLGGLWHGASWNFVIWGGLHGIYLAIERLLNRDGRAQVTPWQTPLAWLKAGWIFILVSVTWVFFRSPAIETTAIVLKKLLFIDAQGLAWPFIPALLFVLVVIPGAMLVRRYEIEYPVLPLRSPALIPLLLLGSLVIFMFASLNTSPFIYFQF